MVDLTWQNEENVDGVVDTDDSSNEDSLPTPCVSILLLKERARKARRARPGIDCDVIRDIREEERSGHIFKFDCIGGPPEFLLLDHELITGVCSDYNDLTAGLFPEEAQDTFQDGSPVQRSVSRESAASELTDLTDPIPSVSRSRSVTTRPSEAVPIFRSKSTSSRRGQMNQALTNTTATTSTDEGPKLRRSNSQRRRQNSFATTPV